MRLQNRIVLAGAAFSLLPIFCAPGQAQTPPMSQQIVNPSAALIISRYRNLLLETPPVDEAKLRGWIQTLDTNGQWPDVDYTDVLPANWKTSDHLAHIVALSRALDEPNSPLANDPRLLDTINRALDHWIARRYKNRNWWHNDIGVPMLMRDIIVLLGDKLDGDRRTGALAVLNQFGRPKSGNGANTVWEAELGLEYGALTGDNDMVSLYSKMISDEIKVTSGEGVQTDGSFHQHGARLQQFQYGGAFLSNGSRLAWQLSGTPWAFPSEKLRILTDMVLNGNQWMVRGIYSVPGTMDRSASRPRSLRSGDMRASLRLLIQTVPERAAELGAVLARQEGKGNVPPLVGFRAFPRSDFAAYHRPDFTFFLKTVSDRTLLSESINNENLKGKLLNEGDGYLVRDGQEYFDLPPLWNWDLLPGITWTSDAGPIQRQPFVGSIGDGINGATAMDIVYGAPNAPTLSGHKFWACHGDAVVALISNLRDPNGAQPVRTALDQALLRGPVTYGDAAGQTKTLAEGTTQIQARWVQHNGFAYVPIGDLPLTLQTGPVTGKWSDINKSEPSTPITKPMFLPVLEHGTKPDGQNSGYALLSASTPQVASQLAAKPTWKVVQNDATCQAVLFDDGTLLAVFWQPGQLGETGHFISVDKPCLILESRGQIRVSDPTQKGGALKLILGLDNTQDITLPTGGEASTPIFRVRHQGKLTFDGRHQNGSVF